MLRNNNKEAHRVMKYDVARKNYKNIKHVTRLSESIEK